MPVKTGFYRKDAIQKRRRLSAFLRKSRELVLTLQKPASSCREVKRGNCSFDRAGGGPSAAWEADVTGILGYIPGHCEVIKRVRPANLFAGPDAGGERAAAAYAHRESAKLNGSTSCRHYPAKHGS